MTAQAHETLILDGEHTSMAFCPPIPKNHARVINVDEKDVKRSNSRLFSTGCWRHYLGTWEIKNGRFYLVGLVGIYSLVGAEPLFADWFTGVLRIPRGEMLQYVHMGFGSVFEEEVHIRIEKGIVIGSRVIDNRGNYHDKRALAWLNLPGFENRFPGDDSI
jgi:hypothetical protein